MRLSFQKFHVSLKKSKVVGYISVVEKMKRTNRKKRNPTTFRLNAGKQKKWMQILPPYSVNMILTVEFTACFHLDSFYIFVPLKYDTTTRYFIGRQSNWSSSSAWQGHSIEHQAAYEAKRKRCRLSATQSTFPNLLVTSGKWQQIYLNRKDHHMCPYAYTIVGTRTKDQPHWVMYFRFQNISMNFLPWTGRWSSTNLPSWRTNLNFLNFTAIPETVSRNRQKRSLKV